MKDITIFTPTYNRATLLERTYISLCNQTVKNFVWIVIDDGSTDDTRDKVSKFINQNIIEIRYFFQDNSGKHVAYNKAIQMCDTTWFGCLDSDDYFTEDAIEDLYKQIGEEKNNLEIIGFCSPKCGISRERIYRNWTRKRHIHFYDLYDKHIFKGEAFLLHRLDVIKKYPFPTFEGEKFVSENVLYRRIDSLGLYRASRKEIYCFEYKDGGYTNQGEKLRLKNINGALLAQQVEVEYSNSLLIKIKSLGHFRALKKTLINQANVNNPHADVITYLGALIVEKLFDYRIKSAQKE